MERGPVSLTLSVPAGRTEAPDKIRVRKIALASGEAWQVEEIRGPKAFHKNLNESELQDYLDAQTGNYTRGEFLTASGRLQLLVNRKGKATVIRKTSQSAPDAASAPGGARSPGSHSSACCPDTNASAERPTQRRCPCVPPATAAQPHNRQKKYILPEGQPIPFLVHLGVMTADGRIIRAKYDKYRQINRFLEYIEDILPDVWPENPAERRAEELVVVDFGCGKSYLTFAVQYYLAELKKIPVRIYGLDLKEDVITACSALARDFGCENLVFSVGDIANFSGTEEADLVITLHACDTATDYALAKAVRWQARGILSVPCCQHELNAQISGDLDRSERSVLRPAFRFGLVRERMAALFTDVLRAELLQSRGYRVQLLEFIDMAHTPKNILIRAVRNPDGTRPPDGQEAVQYEALRDFLGASPTLEKELI